MANLEQRASVSGYVALKGILDMRSIIHRHLAIEESELSTGVMMSVRAETYNIPVQESRPNVWPASKGGIDGMSSFVRYSRRGVSVGDKV